MPTSAIGLIVGLLLGIAAIIGGFGGFVLAIVLGGIGFAVAGQLGGQFDLIELVRGRSRD